MATGQGGARWYPASVRAVLVTQGHAERAGIKPKRGRGEGVAGLVGGEDAFHDLERER